MKYNNQQKPHLKELESESGSGRFGKRQGPGLTGFLACLTSLTLILSACGPQAAPQAGGPTKSDQDQSLSSQTASSQAKDSGPELQTGSETSSHAGIWDYMEPETMPPLEGPDVSPSQHEAGYRLDNEMGYTYYLPRAWRKWQDYIHLENPGNDWSDDQAIYASRYFYFLTPDQANELKELESKKLTGRARAKAEENILSGKTPLMALIIYRNDHMQDNLSAANEVIDFNYRKIIRKDGNMSLVLARAKEQDIHQDTYYDPIYRSIYDSIDTIVNSLSFLPPNAKNKH